MDLKLAQVGPKLPEVGPKLDQVGATLGQVRLWALLARCKWSFAALGRPWTRPSGPRGPRTPEASRGSGGLFLERAARTIVHSRRYLFGASPAPASRDNYVGIRRTEVVVVSRGNTMADGPQPPV